MAIVRTTPSSDDDSVDGLSILSAHDRCFVEGEAVASLVLPPLAFVDDEDAAEHQCGSESEQCCRREDDRCGRPAVVLDPQAERQRADKLAEIAGLLD